MRATRPGDAACPAAAHDPPRRPAAAPDRGARDRLPAGDPASHPGVSSALPPCGRAGGGLEAGAMDELALHWALNKSKKNYRLGDTAKGLAEVFIEGLRPAE